MCKLILKSKVLYILNLPEARQQSFMSYFCMPLYLVRLFAPITQVTSTEIILDKIEAKTRHVSKMAHESLKKYFVHQISF